MKAVGIKNLKNNLSRYLDMVRQGEVVYVTDRDDVIAEIHKPISPPTTLLSRWQAFLNEGERRGTIVPAAQTGPSKIADLAADLPPAQGEVDLAGLINEMRDDRF